MTSQAELAEITWTAACHHEAAHAAALVAYGVPIKDLRLSMRVTLLGGPQPDGVLEDAGPDKDDDEELAQSIVVSLVGAEAEAHVLSSSGLRRGKVRSIVKQHATGDMENVWEELARMSCYDRGLMRRLEREAAAMVSDTWDSIVDIAEALSDNNGYLTGDQIYEIA